MSELRGHFPNADGSDSICLDGCCNSSIEPVSMKVVSLLVIDFKKVGSPIKNGHDALQSLEAIDMLPVTPTFLVTSRAALSTRKRTSRKCI